jgi:hypothetical protein
MRIALTHNLCTSNSEEEAEFDFLVTLQAITEGLANLGHEVLGINLSGSLSKTVAALEDFSPNLIFNAAVAHKDKTERHFYPVYSSISDCLIQDQDPMRSLLH